MVADGSNDSGGPGGSDPTGVAGDVTERRVRSSGHESRRQGDRRNGGLRADGSDEFSAYEAFTRAEWASLRSNTPLTLSEQDLASLRGVNEQLSLTDVVEVYLPLSRLLNLHFRSARALSGVRDEFLGRLVGSRPYVVAIAGSVAVGKSTFARVLRALLARWPDHPRGSLVTTNFSSLQASFAAESAARVSWSTVTAKLARTPAIEPRT